MDDKKEFNLQEELDEAAYIEELRERGLTEETIEAIEEVVNHPERCQPFTDWRELLK